MVCGLGIYVDEYNYHDSLQAHLIERMDLFSSMAAILNSAVSNRYYGMLSMYLPPKDPIIAI